MNSVLASILGIGFWVIAALAIVTLMAYVYVVVQYYHWDKQDRERNSIVQEISDRVTEKMKEVKENAE